MATLKSRMQIQTWYMCLITTLIRSMELGGGRIIRLCTGRHGMATAGMVDSHGVPESALAEISFSDRVIGATMASTFTTLDIRGMAIRGSTTRAIVTVFRIAKHR